MVAQALARGIGCRLPKGPRPAIGRRTKLPMGRCMRAALGTQHLPETSAGPVGFEEWTIALCGLSLGAFAEAARIARSGQSTPLKNSRLALSRRYAAFARSDRRPGHVNERPQILYCHSGIGPCPDSIDAGGIRSLFRACSWPRGRGQRLGRAAVLAGDGRRSSDPRPPDADQPGRTRRV
jgi:hypothetical protein